MHHSKLLTYKFLSHSNSIQSITNACIFCESNNVIASAWLPVTNCQCQNRILIFFSLKIHSEFELKYCRQNHLTNAYSRNEMMRSAFHFVSAKKVFYLVFIARFHYLYLGNFMFTLNLESKPKEKTMKKINMYSKIGLWKCSGWE